MDEQQNSAAAGQPGTTNTTGRRWYSRRGLFYGIIGAGAFGALFAAPIWASVTGEGGGFHRMCASRWGHRGGAEMHEHMKVALKYALRDVDASDDQQARIEAIVTGAFADVTKLKAQHKANREEFRAQLGSNAIDRDALERLRKSEMALADDASKRLVQALADIGDVLTPEQRQALIAKHHRGDRD